MIASLPTGGIAVLVIAEMKVGGTLPEDLGQRCAEAEELCLYDLELTGAVPASLGKCAKLKELLLNGNQLEGPIPDDLGQCRELVALQLECNKLSGGVPASLGSCTKLKGLRLHMNQLEGPVPVAELAALTALKELNLTGRDDDDDEGGLFNEGLTITASGAQELREALTLTLSNPVPNLKPNTLALALAVAVALALALANPSPKPNRRSSEKPWRP